MLIGKKNFDFKNKFYIMGILNVTHDSFFDGNLYNDIDKALYHCEKMINDGADIIDVGGQSTKPGYKEISDNEEIDSVLPVIKKIHERFDIPISIDTYKHNVAREAINSGCSLVNDIHGFKYDNGEMARLVAETNICACLMYYGRNDINIDAIKGLNETIEIAIRNNVKKDKIILDPGIGFTSDKNTDISLMKNLKTIKENFDFPLLIGISNKSMISKTLNLPKNDLVEGTIAANVFGACNGASIFRVHNVLENKKALKMVEAIIYGG